MNNGNRIFIYRDSRGNITAREVTNISESNQYIQGFCLNSAALRTFRKDRILEFLSDPTKISEKFKYYKENSPPPIINDPKKPGETRSGNKTGKSEICFTGFKKDDKDVLIEIAEYNGMFIRTQVTTNLDFLCCGYNAGLKKIEASRHQGVVILNQDQFMSLLETGGIPDQE